MTLLLFLVTQGVQCGLLQEVCLWYASESVRELLVHRGHVHERGWKQHCLLSVHQQAG